MNGVPGGDPNSHSKVVVTGHVGVEDELDDFLRVEIEENILKMADYCLVPPRDPRPPL